MSLHEGTTVNNNSTKSHENALKCPNKEINSDFIEELQLKGTKPPSDVTVRGATPTPDDGAVYIFSGTETGGILPQNTKVCVNSTTKSLLFELFL